MNIEEFENKAYEIATANCLTETFNKEQYSAMSEEEVFVHVWEPFENFSEGELCAQIQQIADDIIRAYKHLIFGSDVIINDNALFEDTVEGLATRVKDDLTEEQVREFLDEDEMSFVMEKMFDAQSDAIIEIEERAIRHFKEKEQ